MSDSLPVVIIGAGPVGLAAAAHLRARGFVPIVLEAGTQVGAGIRRWPHVRMFSPWEYTIDRRCAELLTAHGWQPPDPAHFPTGRDVVEQYLGPLAATPELAPQIHFDARVVGVTRYQRDRMKNTQRNTTPFVVRYLQHGQEREQLAQALVDASGVLDTPNPIGAAGLPALGERAAAAHIAYGTPDVLGADRSRYAGRRVLVVGSGHSAFNVLADLALLAQTAPGMQIHWAVRRPLLQRVPGGGGSDPLQERDRLGRRIARLVEDGTIVAHTSVHIDRIEHADSGWIAWSATAPLPPVDELIGATGFRPDLSILSELRLDIDAGTQAPSALAPLIDPDLHSCGSVRPHGAVELRHPDANLYVVGMKSYGRAPTFLLLTGYEQVRSVAAAIAGDWEAARRVELVLPETGACVTPPGDGAAAPLAAAACCGGPAPADTAACCVADADAKARGEDGCGCRTVAVPMPVFATAAPVRPSCCGPARS